MKSKVVAIIGLIAAAVIVFVVYTYTRSSHAEVEKARETPKTRKESPKRSLRSPSVHVIDASGKRVSGAGKKKQELGRSFDASKDSDNSSSKEDLMTVASGMESSGALSNPDLSPAVMDELREIFSQAVADGLTGDNRLRFMQALSCYKPSVILGAAGSLMKCGTVEERESALYAVGMFFGKESETGVPFTMSHPKDVVVLDGGVAAGASSETSGEENVAPAPARPTQELISTVSAGLSDADAGVRDMAFDVMRSLPDDESGILAANLLSDGDASLQGRLMREAGNDENGVRFSLMGMGSENQEVRSLAAANLKNTLGQEFASQKEASEWYEAHHTEFPQGAGKTTPESGEIKQKGTTK